MLSIISECAGCIPGAVLPLASNVGWQVTFVVSYFFLFHTALCFTSSSLLLCILLSSRFAVGVCLDYTDVDTSCIPGSWVLWLPCPVPIPKQRSLVRHVSWTGKEWVINHQ